MLLIHRQEISISECLNVENKLISMRGLVCRIDVHSVVSFSNAIAIAIEKETFFFSRQKKEKRVRCIRFLCV